MCINKNKMKKNEMTLFKGVGVSLQRMQVSFLMVTLFKGVGVSLKRMRISFLMITLFKGVGVIQGII